MAFINLVEVFIMLKRPKATPPRTRQQDVVLKLNDRLTCEAAKLRFLEVVLTNRETLICDGEVLTELSYIISELNDQVRDTGLLAEQLIDR